MTVTETVAEFQVKTFKITISVPGDIDEKCKDRVLKRLEKSTVSLFGVIEYGDSQRKHLHICACFKTPPAVKQYKHKLFKEHVYPFHPDATGRHAVTMITMYDHKWYDEYLKKEPGREIVHDDYKRQLFEEAFPDADTQRLLQEKAKTNRTIDPCCIRLAKLFRSEHPDATHVTRESVLLFLHWCVQNRELNPPKDDRTFHSLHNWTYRFLTNDQSLSSADKKYLAREGPDIPKAIYKESDNEDEDDTIRADDGEA